MSGLELRAVEVEAQGRKLLDGVSLRVDEGDFVAIVGPNGAGKTTLLRAVLGLLRASRGEVLIDGASAHALGGRERAARVAWLPQHLAPSEPLTALEVVLAARYRFDEPLGYAKRQALAALERLRVAHLAAARIDRLSGGERQRVALAALLAQDARLLLVDEPANHLDPGQQAETYRLLGQLWSQGYGVICVTHDVNLLVHAGAARELRLVGLARGAVVFERRFDDPELADRLGALFGVKMRGVEVGARRLFVAELEADAAGAPP